MGNCVTSSGGTYRHDVAHQSAVAAAYAADKKTPPANSKWFYEEVWEGQVLGLQYEQILHDSKSAFQQVSVCSTKGFGNVLVLDGDINLTEKDELAYHEMVTHLPLFSCTRPPQTVLVVGGGDGGVVREVLKHKSVTRVVLCEIDQMVMDVAKKYFKNMASIWNDPRLTIHCADAAKFVAAPESVGAYDVIICDSSDPVGPGKILGESKFYADMGRALKPGGRTASYIWNTPDQVAVPRLIREARGAGCFANVEFASTQVTTYCSGQIGWVCCSKADPSVDVVPSCARPLRPVPADMKLDYYHSALHESAFVVPLFMKRVVDAARSEPNYLYSDPTKQSLTPVLPAATPVLAWNPPPAASASSASSVATAAVQTLAAPPAVAASLPPMMAAAPIATSAVNPLAMQPLLPVAASTSDQKS